MENKIYYIYHIPTFLHKDGRIGKIGCTEEEDAKVRVEKQGYTEYEILETHTDIIIASDREIELQKQYGYPVDKVPYHISRKQWGSPAGKKGGQKTADSGKFVEARKISKKKLSKAVLVYKIDGTFINEYESRNECARQLNIDRRNISKVCLGIVKQTMGYVIKYKPNL